LSFHLCFADGRKRKRAYKSLITGVQQHGQSEDINSFAGTKELITGNW
jgi:hypothetical protein